MQTTDKAAILAPFEKRVQDANSEVAKQHAQACVGTVAGVVEIIKKTTLTLPNRALDPATLPLTVDLGGYTIVIEAFPGHSGTDLIVKVTEQNVVFTGDLLFNGSFPATFDEQSTISGWRNTLKTLASFDKDTIFVPGHGQLCGQEGIALARNVFDDIVEQAEKMYQAGVPVSEAVDRYAIPEKFKSMPMWSWNFCIATAITKLYAEWGGK
jgi:glyoxylase-like metal-dependent hydrolase (beta-lactamase superfamily II)